MLAPTSQWLFLTDERRLSCITPLKALCRKVKIYQGKHGVQSCPFINFPLTTEHFSMLPAFFTKFTFTMQRYPSSKFHTPYILSYLSVSKETQKRKRKCSYSLFHRLRCLDFIYLVDLTCLFFILEAHYCLSKKSFDNWIISGIVKITRKQPWHNWLGGRFSSSHFQQPWFNFLSFVNSLFTGILEEHWVEREGKIIVSTSVIASRL